MGSPTAPDRNLEGEKKGVHLEKSISDLAAALVGGRMPGTVEEARAWMTRAARHRVDLLLADRLIRDGWTVTGGDAVKADLAQMLQTAAIIDRIREQECRVVYAAFDAAGVRAVVIKGGAVAHTIYSHSYLRPRIDTDILIAESDRSAVARTLTRLGYTQPIETSGDLVTAQSHFQKRDRVNVLHAWDVHWKLSNAVPAANALPVGDALRNAVPLPGFDGVLTLGSVDALTLACVHRVVHHADAPDLIWLYDIHLLAGSLSVDDWDRFVRSAITRRIWTACARSLSRAHERFNTKLPARARVALVSSGDDGLAGFAQPGLREIDVLRLNILALPTWSERLRLVGEHLFPPLSFMKARYSISHWAALPCLYLHRILTGAPKWLRPRERAD